MNKNNLIDRSYHLFGNLLILILSLHPIDNHKIVFTCFKGNSYGDSPKYITEELLSKNYPVNIVWLVQNSDKMRGQFPCQVHLVDYYSIRAIWELATAKIWIKNNMSLLDVGKRKKQIYIQTWHGFGPKKDVIDTGGSNIKIYLKLRGLQAKLISSKIDYYLSMSDPQSEIFRNAPGHQYKGNILEIGTPRNDIFWNSDIELTNKVYSKLNIDFKTKIMLYAPTYRQHLTLGEYDLDFKSCLSELHNKFGGKWIVLIRMHPAVKDKYNISNQSSDMVIDVSDYPDMQELLYVSEVLVTDYSSSMFDFALTRRPCILYTNDIQTYESTDRSFHMSLDSLPFPQAINNDQMLDVIHNFNMVKYREDIELFIQKYVTKEEGIASKFIVKIIKSIIIPDNSEKNGDC